MAASLQQQRVRQIFLWSLGVVYLFAFLSLYLQIPGLYGVDGILPVHRLMPYDSLATTLERFRQQPTLLFFLRDYLDISPESGMDLLCLIGAALALSTLLFESMRCSLVYAVLWMFYYSMYYFGQTFMWFQWDILLLETGFLAILVAPFNLKFWKKPVGQCHDGVMMWLVKWLLFRLMFASGVVKLTSQCPTWWNLTALNYHYETQCIPTPLAWYAHQLPEWFQKLCVIGTYFIEILVPFLFFVPIRPLRLISFYLQVFFQLTIILTGNYNFFNLTTIALCFCLLDDRYINKALGSTYKDDEPSLVEQYFGKKMCKLFSRLVTAIVLLIMLGYTIHYFNIYLDFETKTVASSVGFTLRGFTDALHQIMPYTIYLGVVSLAVEILKAIYSSLVETKGFASKLWSSILTVFWCGTAIIMFGISLLPHATLDFSTKDKVWPVFHEVYESTEYLSLVNSYGLFRRMTGTEGRPEIVIEGSNDVNTGWKEYNFLFKPGDPSSSLPIVAPHQPRLDWQMWFAALGEYKNNPWFVNFVWRLLHNRKSVLELMDTNPFPDVPPTFIRAKLYHYHFTSWKDASENWWTRKEVGVYLPPVAKNLTSMREFLLHTIGMHYRIIDGAPLESDILSVSLRVIRAYVSRAPAMPLLMSVFTAAVLLISTRKLGESAQTDSKSKAKPKKK
eukprot:m.308033 g.308033  ORF g.308033 m.308033 type:complete len:675 (+) comp43282_c0_seq1:47-2071(+)